MNTLIITTHVNVGGIANYVLSLARSLVHDGVTVTVASSGGDLVSAFSTFGIRHEMLDIKTKSELSPKLLRALPGLAAFVRRNRFDIVHAHTRVAQVLTAAVSALTGIPYVTTCHGFFRPRFGRRLFGCWGMKVIAISSQVKKHLTADFNVDKEKIALIYNGIDVDRFARARPEREISDLKKKLHLGKGPVVGTIGRLSPVKGHTFFVEAFKKVLAEIPEARGIIIGEGPELKRLERLIAANKLERSFHIVAPAADTALYFSLLDVFVFPSVQEGLGLSLLEAMASGNACVASAIGGIKDIIKDNSIGLLVPPQDPSLLGDAILKVLKNRELKDILKENARKAAAKDFSLDRMSRQVINVYEEVTAAYAKRS